MSNENSPYKEINNVPSNALDIARKEERAGRIKLIREASGLSLVEFAQMAGVTKQTQLQYERGNTSPDAEYLDRLFFELRVDPTELVTGVPKELLKGYDAQTRSLAARFQELPPKLRKTVDDVLLLAWLAYQDRRAVHEEVDVPAAPAKRAAKKKL
ncbi:MAG: helix-turn-helix transcriptional regulator [Simplicispira sp.]|nr:helix-turn-helix transcriptional regulator [Simplicispira sp.]